MLTDKCGLCGRPLRHHSLKHQFTCPPSMPQFSVGQVVVLTMAGRRQIEAATWPLCVRTADVFVGEEGVITESLEEGVWLCRFKRDIIVVDEESVNEID